MISEVVLLYIGIEPPKKIVDLRLVLDRSGTDALEWSERLGLSIGDGLDITGLDKAEMAILNSANCSLFFSLSALVLSQKSLNMLLS